MNCNARLLSIGSDRLFMELQEYERVQAVLNDAMSKDTVFHLFEGAAMTPEEEAITEALLL